MLIGRDDELGVLRGHLEGALEGRSHALLVHGDAGIGKTSLLDALAEGAPDGVRVLRARGFESESDIAFAGLGDLLAPLVALRERIPEVQGHALGAALALEPPSAQDRFALPAAILSLLGVAAEDGPLLLIADDVHWFDETSAQALLFAARRLDAEGVVLVLGARDGEPWPFDPAGIDRLSLRGLDDAYARELLVARGEVGAAVAAELVRTAAGNPLALREMPQSLTEEQRAGRQPLPTLLRPGAQIEAAFRARLDALPEDTRRALLVLAAMESRRSDLLHGALRRLELPGDALDAAELAEITCEREGEVDFAHPLLGSTLYHAAPAAQRRAVHTVLAEVSTDPQRRAWHLAMGTAAPDESVAAELESAARDARDRGGQATAAHAFARAAELSVDVDQRVRRMLEAANDHVATGDVERGLELADEGLRQTDDEALRAQLRRIRAQVAMRRVSPSMAFGILKSEADRLADRDPLQAAVLMLEACAAPMMTGDMGQLREAAGRARELSAGVDGLVLIADLLIGAGLVADGEPEGARIMAAYEEQLLSNDDLVNGVPEVVVMAGHSAIWLEEDRRADAVLTGAIEVARSSSAVGRLVYPLAARSLLDLRRGNWVAALADADESVRLARDTGQSNMLPISLGALARVEAAAGRSEAARAHAQECVELSRVSAARSVLMYGLHALGLDALGAARLDEALGYLDECAEIATELRQGAPAIVPWAPDRIEVLVRLGRTDDARAAVDALARQAQRTQVPWALAVAERGEGMLAGEAEFAGRFEAALRLHEGGAQQPFEVARTQLVFGERLRRAGERVKAREQLDAALATFERLGARPWEERTRTELNATGRTARRRDGEADADELTPQELQIARLVTEGLTNKEVGAALFLSPKTIEYHLRSVFRKLDVRSRTELAATFRERLPAAA